MDTPGFEAEYKNKYLRVVPGELTVQSRSV